MAQLPTKNDLIWLYVNDKWNAREISMLFGISTWKVYHLLEKFGLPKRKPGGARRGNSKIMRDIRIKEHNDLRCSSINTTTRSRCKNYRARGSKYCRWHMPRM